MNDFDLVAFCLDKRDVLHPDAEQIEHARQLIQMGVKDAMLSISGYDDDPRELYEIPECCTWARWFVQQFRCPDLFGDEALSILSLMACGARKDPDDPTRAIVDVGPFHALLKAWGMDQKC